MPSLLPYPHPMFRRDAGILRYMVRSGSTPARRSGGPRREHVVSRDSAPARPRHPCDPTCDSFVFVMVFVTLSRLVGRSSLMSYNYVQSGCGAQPARLAACMSLDPSKRLIRGRSGREAASFRERSPPGRFTGTDVPPQT